MTQVSRTFRIFVSSTFDDLKEERNALRERVFPRLRELCVQHGARFQAIDLRWGVSEEAAFDQQTMNICLGEIERCRKISPRPNFIVLLGDRYGWRPLPPQIGAEEFDEICRRISAEEQQRLRERYLRDDNAVPPEYCLKPREGEHEDFDRWEAVERDLRSILLRAVEGMPLEAYDRMKYEASATEQEIAQGALRVADAPEHVFCFFRTIKDLPQDASAEDFVDLDANGGPDKEAAARRDALKGKLRGLLPGNTYPYEAGWTGSGVTADHLDKLCDDVFKALSRIIEEEIVGLKKEADQQDKEVTDHDAFGEERARFFTGRASILNAVGEYVKRSDRQPLAIRGASGSGKSALMAQAVQQARAADPDADIIARFIGATPGSSDIRSLLDSLCRLISRRYGADESTVPADYRELVDEFPKRLALATARQPLVVFLDALDQLSGIEGRALAWLPAELPEHVRLVVSTLPGECLSALENKLPSTSLVELGPMHADEGGKLLGLWLEDAGRTLQDRQRNEVLGKFSRDGLPLYLKLAFEEARRWKSYTAATVLSPDIPGVIRDLFVRLSSEANHGEKLVSRSLGNLVAAKNGLSEDELLDMLSSDADVLSEFKRRSPRSPDVQRLPVVVWSRLYFDLEPYLTERSADGASLMTFYHRQLAEVAQQDHLAGNAGRDRHRALARYFGNQELEIKRDDKTTPNLRKMSELPYQQALGEMWDELYETLTDFHFLERKAADVGVVESADAQGNVTRTYPGVFSLLEDFRLALERMPGDGGGRSAVGRDRRPIIVTAVDFGKGDGHVIRCPFCNKSSRLKEEWLGQEIECPQEGCSGPLKVNPFVVGGSRPAGRKH